MISIKTTGLLIFKYKSKKTGLPYYISHFGKKFYFVRSDEINIESLPLLEVNGKQCFKYLGDIKVIKDKIYLL